MTSTDRQRQAHDGVEDAGVDRFVQRGADTTENAAAQEIENTLKEVHAAGEDREPNQRRNAPARQHAVIDLEHEQRAGQVEYVDHAADDADADKGAAACMQRSTKFGSPGCGNGCHHAEISSIKCWNLILPRFPASVHVTRVNLNDVAERPHWPAKAPNPRNR